jgi:hypothetical protein
MKENLIMLIIIPIYTKIDSPDNFHAEEITSLFHIEDKGYKICILKQLYCILEKYFMNWALSNTEGSGIFL